MNKNDYFHVFSLLVNKVNFMFKNKMKFKKSKLISVTTCPLSVGRELSLLAPSWILTLPATSYTESKKKSCYFSNTKFYFCLFLINSPVIFIIIWYDTLSLFSLKVINAFHNAHPLALFHVPSSKLSAFLNSFLLCSSK